MNRSYVKYISLLCHYITHLHICSFVHFSLVHIYVHVCMFVHSVIHSFLLSSSIASSSFRRRKLVQETSEDDEDVTCTRIDDVEDPVGGDDRQMLIGTQGGVTRKVR